MSRCVLKINRQSTEKPHIVLTIETAYFFSDDHHISGYEYFGSWALFSFFGMFRRASKMQGLVEERLVLLLDS